MPKSTMPPHESAFIRLYFVNLLSKSGKYTNLWDAKDKERGLYTLVNRLTPEEVELLVDRIENIQ